MKPLLIIGIACILSGCSQNGLQAQAASPEADVKNQETQTLAFLDGDLVKADKHKNLSDNLHKNSQDYLTSYAAKPDVQMFITKMVSTYQYDADLLQAAFAKIQARTKTISKSDNQPEVITPYYKYRTRFVESSRIREGKKFVKKHQKWLVKAQKDYGVNPEIIAALIGVETFYGRITGKKDVFTSLATLSFDYPRRAKYFQSELEAYLLLARENQWQIGNTKGSYSGALGMTQFMPSNYRKLAVDYDKDGKVDLWGSVPDAIGSVANYLRHHGWQDDRGVIVATSTNGATKDKWQEWINKGRKPAKSLPEWQAMGVGKDIKTLSSQTGLIGLQVGDAKFNYWLADENFFVIMRYNPSRRYSMAVLELAKEIRL
jgi:membrane-bound lytic murein transglycosylase B